MSNFDVTDGKNAPRMTARKLPGTLGVVLLVNAREDGNNVAALSFLL